MTLFICLVVVALAGWFGWLAGRRFERGRIEIERAEAAQLAEARARRPGRIVLSSMKIRR